VAEKTLRTNVTGTIDFIKQFLPLLTEDARVVVVSSYIGSVNTQKPAIRKLIDDPNITEGRILLMSEEYIEAVRQQQMGDWHKSACRTSKAFLNAWARFILPYNKSYSVVT
jgi:carbonyl reductase 1